ncbi:unnamed protein product [Lymnaea stagnalis]|uniref:Interferon-induced transmembrane protein n=1 Tax=Lymnaea stagnalis TaxID=6523 RepID=A0AAV2H6M9_LYMST
MSGCNGNADPFGNQFTHELLSRTSYSYTSDERHQQSVHELTPQSRDVAENYQNNSRYNDSWVSFEDDVDINRNTQAPAQQRTGSREQNNLQFPAAEAQGQGRHDRRYEVTDIGALSKNHHFETDAYGKVSPPSALDGDAPASQELNKDVIKPHPDPSHYDKHRQDRAQPAPAIDPAQPDPYYLLSFQEWYKGYNPAVQQGEQPRQSWQAPSQTQQKPPKVPNYLILSIVACFFCVFIGGVALSYAITSSKQRKVGNYQAAIESASTAQKLCILAIVLGIITAGVTGFMIWYQTQRMNKILSQNT